MPSGLENKREGSRSHGGMAAGEYLALEAGKGKGGKDAWGNQK